MEEQAQGASTPSGRITQSGANRLYMVSMILFISVGYFTQNWSFHYGILITEFLLIAIPAIVYVRMKGASLKAVLRLNKLGFADLILVLVIFFTGYSVALFLNLLWEVFLSLFGQLIIPDIPVAKSWNEYFVLLLVIAVSAGLCEELLFRGVLMKAYEGVGKWPSILFTAVLFSMMHLNIQNLLAPLFLGIILGYVVHTTNSIYAGMLGHFINNGISVTLGFALMQLPFYQGIEQQDVATGLETAPLLAAALFIGIIALVFGTVMILCMRALAERHNREVEVLEQFPLSRILKNFKKAWPLYVGLTVFAAMMLLQVLYIIQGKPLLQ